MNARVNKVVDTGVSIADKRQEKPKLIVARNKDVEADNKSEVSITPPHQGSGASDTSAEQHR